MLNAIAFKRDLVIGLIVLLLGTFLGPSVGRTQPLYQISQNGNTWDVTPIHRSQSPVSFYDYHDNSGHTPFCEDSISKIYFYVNDNNGELSLIIHHDKDGPGPGKSDTLYFDFSSVPGGAYVSLSDDVTGTGYYEFALDHDPEGDWRFGYGNTDGGVLSGLPTESPWSITIAPDFETAHSITEWSYQEETNEINLDMAKPLTLLIIPPAEIRPQS
jgi:hypothetical protein